MKNSNLFNFLLIIFFTFGFLFSPLTVSAQGLPGFSGYPVSTATTCTCSSTFWSYFAPLSLTIVPITGPMVYVPYATVPYPYFNITIPETSHVGAYMPGVQSCWIYVGVSCVLLPAIGTMMYAGTGIPGASMPSGQ